MLGFTGNYAFLNLLEELGLSRAGDVVQYCHKDTDTDIHDFFIVQ